jgi:hypothetical protein
VLTPPDTTTHPHVGLLKTGITPNQSLDTLSRDHVQYFHDHTCVGLQSDYIEANDAIEEAGTAMTLAVFAIDSDIIFSVLNVKSVEGTGSHITSAKPTLFTDVVVNKGNRYYYNLYYHNLN